MAATATTSGSGIFLKRHRTPTVIRASDPVGMSTIDRRPTTTTAPVIAPMAAAVTPFTNATMPERSPCFLKPGEDISVIALWLGLESPAAAHPYVEADLTMKEQALGRLQEPNVVLCPFRADDDLLKFLKTL